MRKHLLTLSAAVLLAGGAAVGAVTAPRTVSPAVSAPAPTATPSALPDCDNLKLGDAWAGVSLHCPQPTATPTATATATATAMPSPATTATALPVPLPTASSAPAPATPAPAMTPPAPKEEDEPGWDCYTDGNLICGPSSAASATEAWDLFNPRVFTEDELSKPFRVTYRGTALQGVDLPPSEWYTIPSSKAGIDHVFEIEFGVTK